MYFLFSILENLDLLFEVRSSCGVDI